MNEHPDYDVVVVGARCAGAPTAMLLARAGHRVLLVDRSAFPSDTASTWPSAPACATRSAETGIVSPNPLSSVSSPRHVPELVSSLSATVA